MADNKNQTKTVSNFVDIIKEMIQDEINKQDNTILCKVASVNNDGSYNVYILPDESTVINSIPALTDFDLQQGDYVYIYKIRNQLNNSFIIKKVGSSKQPIQEKLQELKDQINILQTEIDNIVSEEGDLYLPITAGPTANLTGDLYIKKSAPAVVLVNNGSQYAKITEATDGGEQCLVISLES